MNEDICEAHHELSKQTNDNGRLLVAIDTKLRGILWVGSAFILVYLLPTIIYAVTIEKRITRLEDTVSRTLEQLNGDRSNTSVRNFR